MKPLRPHPSFAGPDGPVVVVVLDGVGVGAGDEADAVRIATTPTLDRLWSSPLARTLRAHGRAVGLPDDGDMGNSEVGHNALGCGRVFDQGALLVNRAIESGRLFEGAAWSEVMKRVSAGGTLHTIGLLSDGNVHSHIDQLIALLRRAVADGARRLRVHALLDGRDVPSTSALEYVDQIEAVLGELRDAGADARIASGGGRMVITMDRYEADWGMVERGWQTHVHGYGRRFDTAREAIEVFRAENPGTDDQNLPPFVVAEGGEPVGQIRDGDAVLCFNFRGDRAIEISRAFDDDDFPHFDRSPRPGVFYAGMMEYDGDTHVPSHYLVEPPDIDETMGERLAAIGVSQLALSETQKYGHVTYFWNGNRSGAFDPALETYIEIPSDRAPFEERPWMKAAEITDRLITELDRGHRIARVNFANGDMVGHTGAFDATVMAIEAIDLQLGRLVKAVDRLGGILLITADHGNADEMFQRDKEGRVIRVRETGQPVVKTSHTLSPVPFLLHDPRYRGDYRLADGLQNAGIANVSATVLELRGLSAPSDWEPSLLSFD